MNCSCYRRCCSRNISISDLAIFRISSNSKIGDTDFSSVGSTITGSLVNLSEAKLIVKLDNADYTTNAQQLAALRSYYNDLNFALRLRSFILQYDGSGNRNMILTLTSIRDAIYSYTYCLKHTPNYTYGGVISASITLSGNTSYCTYTSSLNSTGTTETNQFTDRTNDAPITRELWVY